MSLCQPRRLFAAYALDAASTAAAVAAAAPTYLDAQNLDSQESGCPYASPNIWLFWLMRLLLLLSILFLLLLLLHICTAPLDIGGLALAPITSLLMVRVLE